MEINNLMFYQFGKHLAFKINEFIKPNDNVIITSSNEDADFFTEGLIESLNTDKISLFVYWFKHIIVNKNLNITANPITMSYEEPFNTCDSLIIIKSYVDSNDEIKEALLRIYSKVQPKHTYLLSPIIFKKIIDETFSLTYSLKAIDLNLKNQEETIDEIKNFLRKKEDNKIPQLIKNRFKKNK